MRTIRDLRVILSVLVVLAVLSGCAGMQDKWNKLTPNEKARIIVNGFQNSVESLFDTGKAYVTANPSKQEMWRTKAIPAFDAANKSIIVAINLCAAGGATPEVIYKSIGPAIDAIVAILKAIGVDESKLKV